MLLASHQGSLEHGQACCVGTCGPESHSRWAPRTPVGLACAGDGLLSSLPRARNLQSVAQNSPQEVAEHTPVRAGGRNS